jgi:hypothetical protein
MATPSSFPSSSAAAAASGSRSRSGGGAPVAGRRNASHPSGLRLSAGGLRPVMLSDAERLVQENRALREELAAAQRQHETDKRSWNQLFSERKAGWERASVADGAPQAVVGLRPGAVAAAAASLSRRGSASGAGSHPGTPRSRSPATGRPPAAPLPADIIARAAAVAAAAAR